MMFSEASNAFTGELVFGLAAIVGLGLAVFKGFTRKPALEAEFANKKETVEAIVKVHERIDKLQREQAAQTVTILGRMDEAKMEILMAGDRRQKDLTNEIKEQTAFFNKETRHIGERVARLEERTEE